MDRLHVIGDSHALTFQGAKNVECHWMGASTAHNLYKKYETTKTFFNVYEDKYWFCFGEIDCRLHFWKMHKSQSKTEFSLIVDTVDNYMGAINVFDGWDIAVMAVPPQGYQDNVFDYEFYATREHRQQLTDVFNFVLENKCLETGVTFIDIWEDYNLWPDIDFKEDKCHIKNEIAIKHLEDYLVKRN